MPSSIRVGACIGLGRVGAVYAALGAQGQAVAVKTVPAEHAPSLRHSWEVLRGIDHPHVVRAHRYFEDADGAHLVMDLGIGSLDTVVTDSRTLFRHLRQIADALMTLHARGWIHRDIKPQNVLLVGRDAVLTDFGLALEHPSTAPAAPCGTPAYMAPEAFFWQTGPALDWYALGVTVYELLTNRLPFDRESLQEEILAKRQADFPHLVGFGLDLWEPVVRGLLHPDPRERWDGADVMAYVDAMKNDWSVSRRASA
ncbi:MAG: serine/threonine protein kinase [Alphaproteobacteria bacterium]|nr:serine/threonine protein kinase [Alphaproteobacteria bacterium]